jgi:hypothetical protein
MSSKLCFSTVVVSEISVGGKRYASLDFCLDSSLFKTWQVEVPNGGFK